MKLVWILFLCSAMVGTSVFHHYPIARCDTQYLGFFLNSKVTFRNNGTETWILTPEDRSWGLFMNNSYQTVCLVGHAYPLEMTTVDDDGNALAVFQFPSDVAPGENLTDYATFYIRSKPRHTPNISVDQSGTLDEIPEDLQETYCKGGGLWMTHDQEIQSRADEIAGNETNVLLIVQRLVAWMWTNVEYRSHDPTFYPDQTLFHGEGDCDEQAMLFGTFCRILGIPTFLQLGCIYIEGSHDKGTSADDHIQYEVHQVGWHGWAMAYVPPWGWLPVDLTYVLDPTRDPLSAIKRGAFTLAYTIQSQNVVETDYISSDLTYEDQLKEHDFYLDMTQRMWQGDLLEGDLNRDGKVDILDISIVARAFDSKPGDDSWNEVADLDKNGWINIVDVTMVARDFGKPA